LGKFKRYEKLIVLIEALGNPPAWKEQAIP